MRKIGSGAYGNVFMNNKRGNVVKVIKSRNSVRMKNIQKRIKFECVMTKRIYNIIPRHVVNIKQCGRGIIRLNFYNGGSFGVWIAKNKFKITDTILKNIVLQVLKALYIIHKKLPSFRHNDLHLNNILLSGSQNAVISDFGMACDSTHKNPEYGPYMKKYYGIYPNNNYMYDAHLFLNDVNSYIRLYSLNTPKTSLKLKYILKGGYSGETSAHVLNHRLRVGHKFPWSYPRLISIFSRASSSIPKHRSTPVKAPTKPKQSKTPKLIQTGNEAWKKAMIATQGIARVKLI
jgi:tRNA A-37 threonylcarbamoyl transferase component Bud32